MSTPLLFATDLAIERGNRPLFSAVSLALAPGECVALTGKNGAGKTTLLRVLAGLSAPHRGTVNRNADLLYWGHLPAIKDEFTALENLAELLHGQPIDARTQAAALKQVGLAARAQVPARRLSAGQRRRIGLAWLTLSAAPVWLLDEPLTALDTEGQALFAEAINAHLAKGGAALIATHHPLAAQGIAHTVFAL